MDTHTPLIAVASIWFVAAASPGPNFLLTAQVSAGQSRAHGLAVVCGIGVATAIWGLCGLMRIQGLFLVPPWAYLALKIAGASYLVVVGVRLILRAGLQDKPIALGARPSLSTAFKIGLLTSLANPRSALSVASIFAVALPAQPSISLGLAVVALMVLSSMSWYVCLVYSFGAQIVASVYGRLRRWFDRMAGGLLIFLGVKLALQRS